MIQTSFKILTIFILSLTTYYANAQGCSDAGFCTINSIKPNSSDTIIKSTNQVKVGVSLGSADNSISIFGNYIEYNRQVTNSFGIDAKITSLSQSGNGISNFGISDIYLTGNYKVNEKLKLILGTKIPLTAGNKKKNNIALPMDYQSSLGTFDLIFGAGYEIKKLQIVLAFQQPLSQNKNEFLAENYPINSKISDFQSTNQFKRSSDVLLRVSYPMKLGEKFRITPSLLPIFHLSNDKYTDDLEIENEIKGSQGLTLNGNAYLDYEINSKSDLQLNVGIPFVVRDARPDGLTRSFIVNLEYKVKF
ncbi:hypothetical protein [Flavobacterium myungsuense]|uniref:Transporter n=1 Tax=Flavobacterium myungsuense TaxID=651823 RepID=A0ABW3IXM7_9FLAO